MNNTYSIFYLSSARKFLYCKDPSSAYVYYRDFRIDLLTGIKEHYQISKFLEQLDKIKIINNFKKPVVIHLFYELRTGGDTENLSTNKPLAIAIEYTNYRIDTELPFIREESGAFNKIQLEM